MRKNKYKALYIHCDIELLRRIKNASYWARRSSLRKVVERGLVLVLKEMEKRNGGEFDDIPINDQPEPK